MEASKWFDSNGLVHNVEYPTEDSTENELSFSADYVMLSILLGYMPRNSFYHDRVVACMAKFYHEEWETKKDIAHDERTAMFVAGYCDDYSIFRSGKRWWLHPRDWVFWGYMKYPWLLWPLLPLVCLTNIISCMRTYKGEASVVNLTTSGKRLAYQRNFAANLKLTHRICTWLIERNPQFKSWSRVYWLYYTTNGRYLDRTGHINYQMMVELERNKEQ